MIMMMMTAVTMIPATESPIEALPSFLAPTGSDTAVLLATTAHKVPVGYISIL